MLEQKITEMLLAGQFTWSLPPTPPGLVAYVGRCGEYHINVAAAQTVELGGVCEALVVVPGGIILHSEKALAVLALKTARKWLGLDIDVPSEVIASAGTETLRIIDLPGGESCLVGDMTPRLPPPVMGVPPSWLTTQNWAASQEAKEGIAFFERMLALMKSPTVEGDKRTLPLWHVPATGCVYALDKERKTFTLIKGVADLWHWKNSIVLRKLGYTVDIRPITVEIGTGKSITISESPHCPPPGSGSPSPTSGPL
jgi:hypothetical protein